MLLWMLGDLLSSRLATGEGRSTPVIMFNPLRGWMLFWLRYPGWRPAGAGLTPGYSCAAPSGQGPQGLAKAPMCVADCGVVLCRPRWGLGMLLWWSVDPALTGWAILCRRLRRLGKGRPHRRSCSTRFGVGRCFGFVTRGDARQGPGLPRAIHVLPLQGKQDRGPSIDMLGRFLPSPV